MSSRSTIDNIFIVRQLSEKYREYGQSIWHIFIDYAQAYDSVHRNSLWNVLRSFRVPEKLIRVIKACYRSTKGKVRVGGMFTETFDVETGLKQGCPLSCALFNMVLEWILRRTPAQGDPIRLNNDVSVDRLAYADDVDFLGELFIPRDRQLSTFRAESRRAGLEVKEQKTKAMKASRTPRDVDVVDVGELMLEVVESFKYLGSTLTSDNNMMEEVLLRVSAASKCSWALKGIIGSKALSRTTRVQAYATLIRPIATYACETWSLTKEMERVLLVFEHRILRRILGPVRDADTGEWRIRHNVELRELTRLCPITSFIRAQRLRWAGHVARLPDDSLVKRVCMGRPLGRRPPGRPRLRWEDNVRSDLALLGVGDPGAWHQHAQDRRRWRQLVMAAKDHPGLQLHE